MSTGPQKVVLMSLTDLLMGSRPFWNGSKTTYGTGDHLQDQLRAFKTP